MSDSEKNIQALVDADAELQLSQKFGNVCTVKSGEQPALPKKPWDNLALEEALEQSDFTIFSEVQDVGFYQWKQSGTYKAVKDLKASDILERILLARRPPFVVSVDALNKKLPLPFSPRTGKSMTARFPYESTYMAPIYAAVRMKGVRLDDIDFLFGGSTLGFLARGKNFPASLRKTFVAALIPGSTTIAVVRHKEYSFNFCEEGY